MGFKIGSYTLLGAIIFLGLLTTKVMGQPSQQSFDATSIYQGATKGFNVEQEKISLDLKGIDVTELFRILSLKMDITIVPTKSVSGRVNIFLNNLTLDDALDVILVSQDLACEKKENIINIMTATEYERLYGEKYNEKRKFKTLKLTYAKPSAVFTALGQIKSSIGKIIVDEASGTIFLIDIPEKLELMEKTAGDMDKPLETEFFYLNYTSASDAKEHISSAITPGVGEVIVDERLNKIMVYDFPDRIEKIKDIMKKFDVAPQQVFVEVTVAEISLKNEYQMGLDWEALFNEIPNSNRVDLKGTFPIASPFTADPALSNDYFRVNTGVITGYDYAITLDFLKTFGEIEILSNQLMAILDKQEAELVSATHQPIILQVMKTEEAANIYTDSVEFVDIGITVKVAPEINKKGFVTMKITTETSTLRDVIETEKSAVPVVDKSEVETFVKVKAGNTIILAGQYGYDRKKTLTSPPLLPGTILSGGGASRGIRQDFLIFLTPHFDKKGKG